VDERELAKREAISGFPNYEITKDGRIWSLYLGRWLNPGTNSGGYKQITLVQNREQHSKKVHRLVLETFAGPCPEGTECCHNNGIRTDNRLCNLRWGTRLENNRDKQIHGTEYSREKEGNPNRKLTRYQVFQIRELYKNPKITQQKLAKCFRVLQCHIGRIVRNIAWTS